MNPPESTSDRVWRAVADGTRRRILDQLQARPCTTGELVAAFPDLCRTNIMKHLDVLAAAGLLRVERIGRQRWNHVEPEPLQAVCRPWIDRHAHRMSGALQRLKTLVETPLPPAGPQARSTPAQEPRHARGTPVRSGPRRPLRTDDRD